MIKMGKPYSGRNSKEYGIIHLLNWMSNFNKTVRSKSTHKLIERIIKLSDEKREILIDDIHTAIEERLKVLERNENGRRNFCC
jgi:hypothetical protein